MINRKDLIKKIDNAITVEEIGIIIYSKHLGTILFLSGFEKGVQEKIRAYLKILKEDSEEHKRLLEDAREKILRSKKNVY